MGVRPVHLMTFYWCLVLFTAVHCIIGCMQTAYLCINSDGLNCEQIDMDYTGESMQIEAQFFYLSLRFPMINDRVTVCM